MNKIIPIVIVGIVIVIGIVVISSTGGISSISYSAMSCDELDRETKAVFYSTPATTAETKDQLNQLDLIKEAYQSKNCSNEVVDKTYAAMSCTLLRFLESGPDSHKSLVKAMKDKNC